MARRQGKKTKTTSSSTKGAKRKRTVSKDAVEDDQEGKQQLDRKNQQQDVEQERGTHVETVEESSVEKKQVGKKRRTTLDDETTTSNDLNTNNNNKKEEVSKKGSLLDLTKVHGLTDDFVEEHVFQDLDKDGALEVLALYLDRVVRPRRRCVMIRLGQTFGKVFEGMVELFIANEVDDKEEDVIVALINFFRTCVDNIDLKPIRDVILKLFSYRLWDLVTKETLERRLRSPDSRTRQYAALTEKASDKENGDELLQKFWKTICNSVYQGGQRVCIASLSFLETCLTFPMLRQFLTLYLEDANIVAKYYVNNDDNSDDMEDNWLVNRVERLLRAGERSSDQVNLLNVSRVRLLQRVALRHFEEQLGDLALLTVSKARDAIARGDLANSLDEEQLSQLCAYLGLSHEQEKKTVLAKILQLNHTMALSSEDLIRDKLMPMANWFDVKTNGIRLSVPGLEKICMTWGRRMQLHNGGNMLQHLSEYSFVAEQIETLQTMTRYSISAELKNALENLAPKFDKDGNIVFGNWSRVALPVRRVISRTSIECTLKHTPVPVLSEWAALSVSKVAVMLCQLGTTNDAKDVAIEDVFPAVLETVDPTSGRMKLRWMSKHKQPVLNDTIGKTFMLVRRGDMDDKVRKVGFNLLDRLAKCKDYYVLPMGPIRNLYLGQGSAAQRKSEDCPIKLYKFPPKTVLSEDIMEHVVVENEKRVLIVTRSEMVVDQVAQFLEDNTEMVASRIRKSDLEKRLDHCLSRRLELLSQVEEIAAHFGVNTGGNTSCETANNIFRLYVLPAMKQYTEQIANRKDVAFPFAFFFEDRDNRKNGNKQELMMLRSLFAELDTYRMFELIYDTDKRLEYILYKHCQVLLVTLDDLIEFSQYDPFDVSHIVWVQADQMTEVDALTTFTSVKTNQVERLSLIGDTDLSYIPGKMAVMSLLERMERLGLPVNDSFFINEDEQPSAMLPPLFGVARQSQFIDVSEGEEEMPTIATKYEFRNILEAEFVVAFYQFLVMTGNAPFGISIVTPYQVQVMLILDILHARCAKMGIPFPLNVCTVDQFSQHCTKPNHLLVSMVRTEHDLSDPFVSDPRRIATLMNHSNNLYIFGNKDVLLHKYTKLTELIESTQPNQLELEFTNKKKHKVTSLKDLGTIVTYMLLQTQQQL